MEKFLSIVITIILLFWVLKFIIRLIAPWIVRRMMNKMQQNMDNNGFGGFGGFGFEHGDVEQQQSTDDPEVTIIRTNNNKEKGQGSISDELGGEYTSYEEVK